MVINNEMKKFLKDSYSLCKNSIYITDLENVRGFINFEFEEFNKPISRKLLQQILNFSIANSSESFSIMNGKDNIIPIFEDDTLNIDWKSQLLLPIWYDDQIHGTIIFTNYHKTLNFHHLKFAKTTQEFVKEFLIKQTNEEFKGELKDE